MSYSTDRSYLTEQFVVVNGQEESNFADYENMDLVQTNSDPDLNIKYTNLVVNSLEECNSADYENMDLVEEIIDPDLNIEYTNFFKNVEEETNLADYENIHLGQKINDPDLSIKYTNHRRKVINNKITQWTTDSTRELIRMYRKYEKKLLSVSRGEKHLIWKEIALRFSQLGYNYSYNKCNNKWRNLKMTYKRNQERASKYGLDNVKWCYYKDMANIINSPTKETPDINNVTTVSLNEVKSDDPITTNDNVQPHDHVIVKNIDDKDNTGSSEVWTDAATKCLIKFLRLCPRRLLVAPYGRKCSLWNKISDQLHKNGHNYSGLACNYNWLRLRANYFKRKKKYINREGYNVKWKYYYDVDRLLSAPTETISWSTDSIMCLIDCFNDHILKFMQVAKNEIFLVWKQISKEMGHRGFFYSPRDCYYKFHTLKKHYMINRLRLNMNKKVTFIYYEKMDSVLRDLITDKIPRNIKTNIDTNNQVCKTNKLYDHNCIKTNPNSCSFKTEAITELKNMCELRSTEFDQMCKDKETKDDSSHKKIVDLLQQMVNELKKSNELTGLLISKFPNAALGYSVK